LLLQSVPRVLLPVAVFSLLTMPVSAVYTQRVTAVAVPCASAESMNLLMAAWTRDFSNAHPDTPARVTQKGRFSADFADALGHGEVKVAPFARELFPSERTRIAELAGGPPLVIPVATGSRATKGGTHAIVMFVNTRNPIGRLSLTQLQQIFSRDGSIATWGQVGLGGEWTTRKIVVHGMRVRRETGNPPGIVNYLESRLLSGHAWREDAVEHTDEARGPQALEQIVRAVAADEAAIGYSGFSYAVPGVKPLALAETEAGPFFAGTRAEIARRTYPLSRTLYLVTGPAPDAATRAFLRHALSPEGQRAVANDAHEFFPLVPAGTADQELPAYEPQQLEAPRDARYLTPDGAIAIVGYNDMAEMIGTLDALFIAAHPGFRFTPTLRGTRTAPPALANGESAFAPMGAEFSPQELADYRGATGHEPLVVRVAHASLNPRALSGPVAIIVHRNNPLRSLGLADVADIFAGRSTRGLHPVGLGPETALGRFMRVHLLQGGTFAKEFTGFSQSADVVREVAHDPRAIGFTAAVRVDAGVKVLALAPRPAEAPVALTEANVRAGRYPLDRFLMICASQPLEPWIRDYLGLVLSRDGQLAIAGGSLGYLPLNATEAAAERQKLLPARPDVAPPFLLPFPGSVDVQRRARSSQALAFGGSFRKDAL
jgi:phosphate transport system substrate-binding protein